MTTRAKIYDQYFTPTKLADKVIAAFTIPIPNQIADFAVGDGKLLCAAQRRWPAVRCTAIDIDEEVITSLKAAYPNWQAHTCDFTDAEARKKPLTKRKSIIRLPAIALNPPFSIQEGKVRVRTVTIAGTAVRCSPALAFIVDALTYLEEGGQLVAIIPQGPLFNAQDAKARQLLQEHYGFEIVELISQAGFKNCTPRTAIVRFTAGVRIAVVAEANEAADETLASRLLRGSISNTKVESSEHSLSLPFIHTTDLVGGKLCGPKKRIFLSDVVFATGPAVLIPRVGKPNINKIVLLPTGMKAILSDCVIAVECLTTREAESLQHRLRINWTALEEAYGGTCARYISVDGLSNFLQQLGCQLLLSIKELREEAKKSRKVRKDELAA
jgi:predicted RNA methylase